MAQAPALLTGAVQSLIQPQLDTPYREGGWTIRQIVHHFADSQLNWYVRTKLTLTENDPTIRPFDGDRWSELEDARRSPVEPSLAHHGVHHTAQITTLSRQMNWM
jgi:uncharacterized damage-inducible protein DinB